MRPEYFTYAALALALIGIALGVLALVRMSRMSATIKQARDLIQDPRAFATLHKPATNAPGGSVAQGWPTNQQVALADHATHRIAVLEREVRALQQKLAGGFGALQQNLPDADVAQAMDPRSPPPAEAVAVKPEVLYLLYTDKPSWPANAVSKTQHDNSMFRAELDSPTTGTLRLIPGSQRLQELLRQPTDFPSPALKVVQQGTKGELARETPGRIQRGGDGGWRVVEAVHVMIS